MATDEDQMPGVERIDATNRAGGNSSFFMISAGDGRDVPRDALDNVTEAFLQIERETARRNGAPITPDVEALLRRRAAERRALLEREARARGVAPHLVHLLGAASKRAAERLAKQMIITHQEFADLIFNARAQLGYRHRLKVREFNPEHHDAVGRQLEEALRDATPGQPSMAANKAFRKMIGLRQQYKSVHLHMFERGRKWHAFFFDFTEVKDAVRPHVHYVSHYWAEIPDRGVVWDAFDERWQSIPRRVHIRYECGD